jgi:hypothetical protein
VRTRKLCTRVSIAIMLAPTSCQGCRRLGAASKDARQAHGQDLVRDAIDLSERSNQSFAQSGDPIGVGRVIGGSELPVDPADQVAIGNVANEQEKSVGHLVEPTIAQPVGGQRTGINVIRL